MSRRIPGPAIAPAPDPVAAPRLGPARNPSQARGPSRVNAILSGSASPYGGRFEDSGRPPRLRADPLTPPLNRS